MGQRNGIWVLLAAVVAVLACPSAAFAQEPLVVTTTADDGNDECTLEKCTLRDAVITAGTSGAPATISLPAGTYRLVDRELVLEGKFNLEGAGARSTVIHGDPEARVAYVAPGSDITVTGVSVTRGAATGTGMDGDFGGGFRVAPRARLVLSRVTVSSNYATWGGGGISTAGEVHVEQSTVSGNDAGEGTGAPGEGAGIHVEEGGRAVLVNATVSGNFALSGEGDRPGRGGGLYTAGEFTLENATIARNDAAEGGGLYQDRSDGPGMEMVNTLLAENAGRQCAGLLGVVEGHHNLAGDGSCELDGVGDLPDADARLGLLRDNGGPTDTHALGFGSEALDAAGEPCLEDDQRNLSRPAGRACDIGAVERRRDPVVTTHLDGDDGECDPDDCTLRDALLDSERDAIIFLEARTYEVAIAPLQLRHERQVVGTAGARKTTLEASGDHRVLTVPDGSPTLSGVLVTGGAATVGGGILVGPDAIFSIVNSTVAVNAAADGGGIASRGHVNLVASTISSNRSETGGGLLTESDGSSAFLINSTVTGNSATSRGGGLANRGGFVETLNTTIAGNGAASSGDAAYGDSGVTSLYNTIVAGDGEVTCDWGAEHELFADHSLADDDDCFEPGEGNLVQDPKLGPLASGLGPTDVYPLLDGSPAIDAGSDVLCPETDQRDALRFRCDIGAYEGTSATGLRVVTLVLDGPARPSDFRVHVYSGGEEVRSDPGSATGTSYALDPGSYRVLRTGPAGYAASFSGDCEPDGDVSLAEGEQATCTLALDQTGGDDDPPPPQNPPQNVQTQQLPEPEAGEEVNALPKSGTVRVKVAGTNRFVELEEGQQIPVGSVVDTTKGRVTIVAAGGQSADFFDGIFRLSQTKGAKPVTTLTLVEALSCPKAGKAIAAAKKKKRRLWGDGSGKFKTEGKHSAATVVGTKWLVEDRCASTLTKVTRGKVRVRDFAKRRNVVVRAGKQYVARAR